MTEAAQIKRRIAVRLATNTPIQITVLRVETEIHLFAFINYYIPLWLEMW